MLKEERSLEELAEWKYVFSTSLFSHFPSHSMWQGKQKIYGHINSVYLFYFLYVHQGIRANLYYLHELSTSEF